MTVAAKPRPLAPPDPLVFRRQRLSVATLAAPALGGRWVGTAPAALDAPLLAPDGAVFDGWAGGTVAPQRRHGCVSYAGDGHWLHGCAEIDDDPAPGLPAAAQRAYTEIFEVLAASRCPHLLRVWNYLARINRETAGLERYRQFNAGRQQAFIDARRSVFEGAPAASALGMHGGPLRVYFLAGRQPPLAIENPRQTSAYRYPDRYGQHAPTFSRAALADAGGGRCVLFISGTASIVGHATVHPGDVRRQAEECLANLAAVRAATAARTGVDFAADALSYTVYVRHAADLAAVRSIFERSIGPGSPAALDTLYLQADICRADLLVEIEAHGFAPALEPLPSSDRGSL